MSDHDIQTHMHDTATLVEPASMAQITSGPPGLYPYQVKTESNYLQILLIVLILLATVALLVLIIALIIVSVDLHKTMQSLDQTTQILNQTRQILNEARVIIDQNNCVLRRGSSGYRSCVVQ